MSEPTGAAESARHTPILKPRNSAGRNMPQAIATGAGLGALVLLCVFVIPHGWYPLVAAAVALATWEVAARLRDSGYIVPTWTMIVGGQLMLWLSWPFGTVGLVSGYVTSVLAVMIWRLFHHGATTAPRNYLRDMSVSLFVLTWIPLFGSFAAMISHIDTEGAAGFGVNAGALYIITFMLCVVASDVFGFAAGVMFGKHPMAPAVSPKKSWEGFAGSLVGGVVTGALCMWLMLDRHFLWGALLGALLVACAVLGDLVESQVKRDLGIKDMSNLLPGHGGMMDRLDGMLPSAMVTWVVLSAATENLALPV